MILVGVLISKLYIWYSKCTDKKMFPVLSTVYFGVSLALTRMLNWARTWASYHPHIFALRLLLLLVVEQIMVMLLLWQQRLNPTVLPNITTRPSNTASVWATVVDHHATVV